MRQTIVTVVPEHGSLFEIAAPSGIWGAGRPVVAGLDIEYIACGVHTNTVQLAGDVTMGGLGVLADHIANAHTIIVPTWPITTHPVDPDLVATLRAAHETGSRLVGLCLGAFPVAATTLLDNSTAVTHWRARSRFEADYPTVDFEPDTLYVDHGDIVTSAGSAAAIDCCLHLVRKDHGAEAAAAIARSLVTAPHRSGTQSQFAAAPPIVAGADPLGKALTDASNDMKSVTDVGTLAAMANMSRRSLERRLRDRVGVSPKEWIDEQRLIAACRFLEQPELSIDEVADAAGYGSTPSLRRALRAGRGTTPTQYREMFR